MNPNFRQWIAVLAAAAALAGCQSAPPTTTSSLDDARAAYHTASSDPRVNRFAAPELAKARESLTQAENTLRDSGDTVATNNLAYLARQRAMIAREVGVRGDAEERIRTAAAERDRSMGQSRSQDLAASEARAAQLEQELMAMRAQNTERGMIVTLPDVVFDTGSATLRPGAMASMDRIAALLRANPERRVAIEGFTDSQGNDSTNLQLSASRANMVRAALMERDVAMDRIVVRPYGENFPIASNDTQTGRQLNRRVEIVFSDPAGQLAAARTLSGEYGSQPRIEP